MSKHKTSARNQPVNQVRQNDDTQADSDKSGRPDTDNHSSPSRSASVKSRSSIISSSIPEDDKRINKKMKMAASSTTPKPQRAEKRKRTRKLSKPRKRARSTNRSNVSCETSNVDSMCYEDNTCYESTTNHNVCYEHTDTISVNYDNTIGDAVCYKDVDVGTAPRSSSTQGLSKAHGGSEIVFSKEKCEALEDITKAGVKSLDTDMTGDVRGKTRSVKTQQIRNAAQDEEELVVKTESLHGFVVGQWCDLGPSQHIDGHSPVLPASKVADKIQIKVSPDSKHGLHDNIVDTSIYRVKQLEETPCKEVQGSKLNNSGHAEIRIKAGDCGKLCLPKREPSLPAHGNTDGGHSHFAKLSVTEISVHSPVSPAPPVQRILPCPLPPSRESLDFQKGHFNLAHSTLGSVQFPIPKLETNTSISETKGSKFILPSHVSLYRMGDKPLNESLRGIRDLSVGANEVYVNRCVQRNTESISKHQYICTQNSMVCLPRSPKYSSSLCSKTVMANTEDKLSFTQNMSTAINLTPRPSVFVPGYSHSGFLHQNSFIQPSPFPSPGMVLMSQHPYFFHHMPFMPMLPTVNYPHPPSNLTPVASSLAYADAFTSVGTIGDMRNTLKSAKFPNDDHGKSSSDSLRDTAERHQENIPIETTQDPEVALKQEVFHYAPIPQATRPTLKPKMAGATDFLDPTRMKFGLDDDGSDEDVKVSGDSDSSDEEWQPAVKSLRAGKDDESETDDECSEDGEKSSDLEEVDAKCFISVRKISKGKPTKEPLKCQVCGKMFNKIYHLRRHKMSHSDIRPHQCQICQKSFKQKAHLTGHLVVHERAAARRQDSQRQKTKSEGHKCPGRPRKTYSEKDLSCKECGKSFKTVYRLKRHEQSHTDVRPFSCRICGKGFKQTGHRNEHEANHEKTQKRFLCNLCGVVFRCRSSFNNHMRSHSVEKLRLQKSRDEKENVGQDGKLEPGEVSHTGYDCPYCTEKFATAQALNSHLETHVEVKQRRHVQPYSCDVCRRAFTYRHNLMKHKLIHKAPEKFAQFYKEKMEAHVASGKPSFKCFKCSKIFLRKETLAKHFKIHSGNKPFKCTICSRDFTQNVHLKVHMRKHTGSRPFQCKECSKSFIDSTALAKHIEYEACNSENYIYHCKICEKRHYYLGSIKQHIRREHGLVEEDIEANILRSERSNKRRNPSDGEKYSCKVCSWKFSEKCNLVRHIKRKHIELIELLNRDLNSRSLSCDTGQPAPTDGRTHCCSNPVDNSDSAGQNKANEHDDYNVDEYPRQLQIDEGREDKSPSAKCFNGINNDVIPRNSATSLESNCLSKSKTSSGKKLSRSIETEESEEDEMPSCREPNCKDELLEGFHKTNFACLNHPSSSYQRDSVSLRSGYRARESIDYSETGGLKSEYKELEFYGGSKDSENDSSSSPSDINFLYNIGLIVSSKAKQCKEIELKHSMEKQEGEMSDDVLLSSGGSSPRQRPSKTSLTPKPGMDQTGEASPRNNLRKVAQSRSVVRIKEVRSDPGSLSIRGDSSPSCSTVLPCVAPTSDGTTNKDSSSVAERKKSRKNNIKSFASDEPPESPDGNCSSKETQCVRGLRENPADSTSQFATSDSGTFNEDSETAKRHKLAISSQNPVTVAGYSNESAAWKSKLPTNNLSETSTDMRNSNGSTAARHGPYLPDQDSPSRRQNIFFRASTTIQEMLDDTKECIGLHNNTTAHIPGSLKLSSDSITSLSTISIPFPNNSTLSQPNTYSYRFPSVSTANVKNLTCDTSLQVPVYSQCSTSQSSSNIQQRMETTRILPPIRDINSTMPCDGSGNPLLPLFQSVAQASPNLSGSKTCSENLSAFRYPKRSDKFQGENSSEISQHAMETNKRRLNETNLSPAQLGSKMSQNILQSGEFRPDNMLPNTAKLNQPCDDYEACPTESHLKHLGLLACKDADEIKTRSYPLHVQYAAFKPWLEELVLNTRPKRSRAKEETNKPTKDDRESKSLTMPHTESLSMQEAMESQLPTTLISPKTAMESNNVHDKTVDGHQSSPTRETSSKRRRKGRTRVKNADEAPQVPKISTEDVSFGGFKVEINLDESISRFSLTTSTSASETDNVKSLTHDGDTILRSAATQQQATPMPVCSPAIVAQSRRKTSSLPQSSSQVPVLSYHPFEVANATTTSVGGSTPRTTATAGMGASSSTADAVSTRRRAESSSTPPSTPDSTMRNKNLFPCGVCGKVFTARHQLKRHELTHTNRRPFTCDQCGRAFRQKVHLSDHIKRHQGQRPFVCAGCGKRFVLKNEMNQHIKNHCKGSGDLFKTRAARCEKPIFTIALTELTPLTEGTDRQCAVMREPSVQPPKLDQDFMTVCGQMYKPGDIISNGSITLRVVSSATDNVSRPATDSKATATTPPVTTQSNLES